MLDFQLGRVPRAIVGCLFSLIPALVSAESPSLKTVLDSAKEHHPKIISALQKVEAQRGKLLSAQGGFDPLLSLKSRAYGSGYYEGSNSSEPRFTVPLETASSDLFLGFRSGHGDFPVYEDEYDTLDVGELGGGISFSLLRDRAIDSRRAEVILGDLGLQRAGHVADLQKIYIGEQAALAYWTWIVSSARVTVFEDLLNVGTRRQKQFEEQVRLGQMAEIFALDNSRAILNRREKLIEQEQQLRWASQKLSLYFRDHEGNPREPEQNPRALLPVVHKELRVLQEQSLDSLLAARPDIRALQTELQELDTELQLAENKMLPKLDLETALTRDYGSGEESREGTEWKGMLQFEFPIYQREARGSVQEVESKARAKRQELRLLQDQMKTSIQALVTILEQSYEQYQILKKEISVTQKLEEAEWERFKAGASDLLIVALREIGTATVRSRALQAQLDNRAAYLQLASLLSKTEYFEES